MKEVHKNMRSNGFEILLHQKMRREHRRIQILENSIKENSSLSKELSNKLRLEDSTKQFSKVKYE